MAKNVSLNVHGHRVELATYGEKRVADNDYLYFGNEDDLGASWDGTDLDIIPLTDDTGAINFGDGTKDLDVKVFFGTTGDYFLCDVGNKKISIANAPSGASGVNCLHQVVTDTGTISTGRNRAFYIEYTSSGAKTGTAGIRTVAIDTTISANVPSWTGIDLYLAALGGANNYTVGNVIPLSIYVDDLGDNVSHFMAIDIGINSSAATTGGESAGEGRHCFIRCREHTAIHTTTSVIRLEGGNAAGHFLLFDNPAGTENSSAILEPHSDTEASDYRIRCHLEHYAVDRYIYLYPV